MTRKTISLVALLAAAFYFCCSNASAKPSKESASQSDVFSLGAKIPSDFMRGFDASTVDFLEEKGASYYDESGQKQDVFKILKSHGVNWVRLRIWHDSSKNDEAGDNCLERTIRMAKRIKSHGMNFLLDFHYSDTWADPGKQMRPSAWDDASTIEELSERVHDYTKEILLALKSEGCTPDMVQLGNEINQGFCTALSDGSPSLISVSSWDNNYEGNKNLAALLTAASSAVREVDPGIDRMVHLASANVNGWTDLSWWFDRIDFDDYEFIGLSWYPFENHGTLADLRSNLSNLKSGYRKEVLVVETSWPWTFDKSGKDGWSNYVWCDKGVDAVSRLADGKNSALKNLSVTKWKGKKCVAASVENQAVILAAVMEATEMAGGCGVFYWGGDWICDPAGKVGNNWENQALFDLDGKCLPSMRVFHP